jgi:hypothetical protein
MAPLGEDGPLRAALFLGIDSAGVWNWWWLPSVDATDLQWQELGTAVPPYLFPPGEIALRTQDPKMKNVFAVGGGAGVAIFGKSE